MTIDEILEQIAAHQLSSDEGFAKINALLEPSTALYEEVWTSAPGSGKQPVDGAILLFDDTGDLAEGLEAEGRQLIVVRPGEAFEMLSDEFRVRPAETADYREMFDRLESERVDICAVVHGWSHGTYTSDLGVVAREQIATYRAFVALLQPLSGRTTIEKAHLLFVHRQPADSLEPQSAAFLGFVRSVRREMPGRLITTVSVDPAADAVPIIERELSHRVNTDVRYAPDRQIVAFRESSSEGSMSSLLRNERVYLVSGGGGGLGRLFTEHLVREWDAKVVICGRSPSGPSFIEALPNVVYTQADVSRLEDVRRLVAETRERFGRIDGVIHAAGVIRDSLLVNKTDEEIDAVLGPKVLGAIHLDEVLRDEPLGFFVCFSAAAASLGNAGQTDYAYANGFLSDMARWREGMRRQGLRSGCTISIAWPLWSEGGMGIGEAERKALRRSAGIVAMPAKEGLAAFHRIMIDAPSAITVIHGEQVRVRELLGTWDEVVEQKSRRLSSSSDREEVEPLLVEDLSRMICEVLKIEDVEIDPEEDFSGYGFDSITLTELSNLVNETYGVETTPAHFFEHRTVATVTSYLAERYGKVLQGPAGETSKQPEVPVVTMIPTSAPLRRETPAPETSGLPADGIAIIGMAGKLPGSEDLEEFWRHLVDGDDLITEVPRSRWDWREVWGDPAREPNKTEAKWGGFIDGVDEFDPLFFGISPREAERMDPQQRLALETAWKAIEDAGYRASALAGTATGVFIGAAAPDYYEMLRAAGVEIDGHTSIGISFAVLANRISHFFDFHGPSEPVDTACSSSLVAVHHAVEAIRGGSCDLALAGGVNVVLTPTLTIAASKSGMLSREGRCKTFDDSADGYVRSEGVGLVLLKRLDRAIADGDHVYAIIRGSAENHGGDHGSITTPNPKAQSDLIVRAYDRAGIDPSTVTYIEAHGTGTRLGDPIEINGLKSAFERLYEMRGLKQPERPHCGIGAVKTNVGHLETAAGVTGLIKTALATEKGWLPPLLHQRNVNPYVDLERSPFFLVQEGREWNRLEDGAGRPLPRRAGVSSFGFGGTNAHVIVEEFVDPRPAARAEDGYQLIVLSAKNEERLREMAVRLARFVSTRELRLADVAWTLQAGREPMEERIALVVPNLDELGQRLAAYGEGRETTGIWSGNAKRDRSSASSLIGGRAGEEFLRVVIEDRDLGRLAQLWVSGVEIDFSLMSGGRRISLPAYPFARERYWVPRGESRPASRGEARLHPLVARNTSTLREQSFTTTFEGNEFYLTDHRVVGTKTLPGVAYLEMARAAAEIAAEERVAKLTNVVWSVPLCVGDDPLEAKILIRPSSQGIAFEVTTSGDSGLVVHAQGGALPESAAGVGTSSVLDLDEIRQRCVERWSGDESYERFEACGFGAGPSFRALRELWKNDDEVLARIALPQHLEHDAEEWRFHPSILDAAGEAVIGLIGDTGGVPWLPFTVAEVVLQDGLPANCWAHVRRSGTAGTMNVSLVDDVGNVLVQMNGLTFRPLQADKAVEQTFFFRPEWLEDRGDTETEWDGTTVVLVAGDDLSLRDEMKKRPGWEVSTVPDPPDLAAIVHLVREQLERDPATRFVYCNQVGNRDDRPQHAAMAGFGRTLQLEHPSASWKTLAVENLHDLAKVLPDELDRGSDEVRFTGGRRETRTWQPASLEGSSSDSLLKERGIYLITGGAGGLGTLVSRFLAREYSARLVLAGRSASDARIEALIVELRALGGDAVYVRADVSTPDGADELVRRTKEEFGRIDGVLHASGTLRDSRIVRKTGEEIAAVLAPKVDAIRHLDEATRDEPLDFMLLFSSAAGVTGNAGQGDYAYANSYLDHFAEAREEMRFAGSRSGRTISINWPLWRDGGMSVDPETELLLERQFGIVPMPDDRGIEILDRVLRTDLTRLLVFHGHPSVQRLVSPARQELPRHVEPAADDELRRRFHEDFTADVVAVLQLPEGQAIDLADDLSAFGFDSLSFTQLANRVNSRFETSVTPAVFFEHPSLASTAGAILEKFRERLESHYGAAASPPSRTSAPVGMPESGTVHRFIEPPSSDDGVAIIGMAGVLPGSADLDEFWEHLDRGDDLITEVPSARWNWRSLHGDPATDPGRPLARWGGFLDDVARFDCLFFGISPREAEQMDPQQRLLLETVWSAIENAGYRASELSGTSTGIFVGVTTNDYYEVIRESGSPLDAHTATGIIGSVLPNRLSYLLNLRGPSEAIDTACSSSLVAIHRAVGAIRDGCPLAIVAGTNLMLTPTLTLAGTMAGMLSPDGRCKTFDTRANGYVRGEGVAAIILKPLGRALADDDHIHAVIRGSAENHGGRAASLTAPNAQAQSEVIVAAHTRARSDPSTITYVEAHGTGTELGDPVEINGLKRAFDEMYRALGKPFVGEPHCTVGSVKTNIGHLEAAAGIAGVLKVVLAMKHRRIPSTLHFTEQNPYIDLIGTPLRIAAKASEWSTSAGPDGRPIPRRAGVSSFGFGGVNAHVVLEEHEMAPLPADDQPHRLVLSAMNEERLRLYAGKMAAHLRRNDDLPLASVAHTLEHGRERFDVELAVVARDLNEACAKLEDYASGGVRPSESLTTESYQTVVRRVPLPTYPFGGERYWVKTAERNIVEVPVENRDGAEPVIVAPTDPHIRDHRLDRELVMPGVGYLEIAWNACAGDGQRSGRFSNVVWSRPLVLGDDPRRLTVDARTESGATAFEIRSEEGLHAEGTISFGIEQEERAIDLDGIRDRCDREWDVETCYEIFRGHGLEHGPSLRGLRELRSGNEEALSRIAFSGDGSARFLDPSILESALQTVIAIVETPADATYVPFAMGSLRIHAAVPESAWVHARVEDGARADSSTKKFDLDIADESGRIVLEIRGFAMRQIARTRPETHVVAGDADLRTQTEDFLRSVVAAETRLPLDQVEANAPLERYGIDSMLVVSITRELEKHFGELSRTLLFEYATISELTGHFMDEHRDRLTAKFRETSRQPAAAVSPPPADLKRTVVLDRRPPRSTEEEVAIVGLSGRYPMARDLNEFWENLKAGRDCITEIPDDRWDWKRYFDPEKGKANRVYSKWGGFIDDVDRFDPLFFGIAPKDAELLDPQERLFLQMAWHTIEDAGYTRGGLANRRVGVFVGVMWGEYQLFGPVESLKGNLLAPGSSYASIANRVSYVFNFQGPSVALDSMCSSSLTAIHFACESIRRGESELAIAGGVNVSLHPQKYIQLSQGRFAASDGRCRSFGEGGDGYVPGEGVGAALLKPLSRAIEDGDHIYGIIRSSSINHGGKTNGYTVPNPNAQSALIAETVTKAGVDPRSISYVEAHGTGTSLGDPIEITALTKAFGDDVPRESVAIGSVKSNVGHLESAAGIAGLTKVLLQMKHGELVPSIHSDELNSNIRFQRTPFKVQRRRALWTAREGDPRRAGISSFGAGGSNAHIILEEYVAVDELELEAGAQLIVLSARDRDRLSEYAATVARALDPEMRLADVAWTLQTGRERLSERVAFVARSIEEAREGLERIGLGSEPVGVFRSDSTPDSTASTDVEAIDLAMRSGDVEELARAWTEGAEVDWNRLHGGQRRKRVSLPGYPFARERYWIPESDQPLGVAALHPLLDENESTFDEVCFTKTFRGDELYLSGHRLDGKRVLPAVVTLEMARAAIERAAGSETFALTDIVWLRPIVVEDGPRRVRLTLRREEDHVSFRLEDDSDLFVQGRALSDLDPVDDSTDLAAVRDRLGTILEPNDCYERAKRFGLDYGEPMRVIRSLRSSETEALADLRLPKEIESEELRLHPALMDGALQSLIAFAMANETPAALPFSVERVDILGALPSRCQAHAVRRANGYDITMTDGDGRVLVRVHGLAVREIHGREAEESIVFLRKAWREVEAASSRPVEGPILLLDVRTDRADRLRELAETDVVLVTPAEAFRSFDDHTYGIDPSNHQDFVTMFDFLGSVPETAVFLWSDDPSLTHGQRLERGIYSVLAFLRASSSRPGRRSIRLVYAFRDGEPLEMAIRGLFRTLRREDPRLILSSVALDQETDAVEAVATEIRVSDGEDVRYESKRRQVTILEEFHAGASNDRGPIRSGGVYLITGGAGGVGLLLAERLVRRYQARVVLAGRSELDERRARKIEELNRADGEVVYVRADVTSRDEVRSLVESATERFGALHGVIHAAGALRDSLAIRKTDEEVAAVIAPKIDGTLALAEATAECDLDFFALFSSIASILGNVGQSDYSFANGFLDAFAETRGGPFVSINWPLWAEGGMSAPDEVVEWAWQTYGVRPLKTESALDGFERLLTSGVRSAAVVEGNRERILRTLTAALDAPREDAETEEVEQGGDVSELRSRTRSWLKELVCAETKAPISAVHATEPLENYGIESVMALSITTELESVVGTLPKTLFFEHTTIAAMSDYLVAERRDALARHFALRPSAKTATTGIATVRTLKSEPSRQATGYARPVETDAIAVIGISGRYPDARDLDELWENLRSGRDSVVEIPPERWDRSRSNGGWGGFLDGVENFDPLLFNISPREANLIDPQERLFLETVWHTLEDAGYAKSRLTGGRVGVYVGVMWSEYQLLGLESSLAGSTVAPGSTNASIANRISYFFGFRGPSLALDTMCSSSLTAIHLACQSLRSGETEYAIAGGVNLSLHPQKYVQLGQGQFLSSDGRCRSFGKGGDGYVPGEGCGAVLLKPLSRALADGDRIHCVIRGTALNHGGRTNGYTVPNPEAQAEVIREALDRSGIDPSTITCIEAHGTGTSLGDPIEIAGLVKAFGGGVRKRSIGSIKSNIGHLESAAGIAGLTKLILQMKHRQLVPSLHSDELNPHIEFEQAGFEVQRELTPWDGPRVAGISSFGAGGSNAHVIVEDLDSSERPPVRIDGPRLFVLSAKNRERLAVVAGRLASFIETHQPDLDEVVYTLQVGREGLDERVATLVETIGDLSSALLRIESGEGDDEIHRGNVAAARGATDLLLDGEEGDAFVSELVRNGKLRKLAQLWVAGVDIDFDLLYRNARPRRIRLPLYPFAEERCWIPDRGGDLQASRRIHPLVETIDEEWTLREGAPVFGTTFSRDDPVVRDHPVHGMPTLPGVGFLEMALAAAERVRPGAGLALRDVVWLQPLALHGSSLEVRTIIRNRGDRLSWEVCSLEGGRLTRHAKGSFDPAYINERNVDLAGVRERCDRTVSGEELYARFAARGLAYGPYLQAVHEIRSSEDEALSEIRIPSSAKKELSRYRLHPSLMDGAIQSIAGIGRLWRESSRATVLSFAVDRVEIVGPARGDRLYAWVRSAGENRYDISVIDDRGNLCVELTGVSVRAIADSSLLYRPVWRAIEVSAAAPSAEGRTVLITGANHSEVEKLIRDHHARDAVTRDESEVDRFDLVVHVTDSAELDDRAVVELFGAAKRLRESGAERLVVVTIDAHLVTENDVPRPAAASVGALAGVIASERRGLDVVTIDLSSSELGDSSLLEPFGAALSSGEREIAVRNGALHIRDFEPATLDASAPAPLRKKGVYVIVGGAGSLGLELSRHLARSVSARLVWIGRREADQTIRAGIAAVQSAGGEVMYLRADAADSEAMAAAVERIRDAFHELHGVFYAAMDATPALLGDLDEESFRSALRAKIPGSVATWNAIRNESLDFFALFSSVQSFVRAAGMSHYASGCAFQDALAERLASFSPFPVISIDWGYWGTVGAAAENEAERRKAEALGFESIGPDEGFDALERILGTGESLRMLVYKGDEDVLRGRSSTLRPLPIQRSVIQRLGAASAALERLCVRLLLQAFQQEGLFREPGKRRSFREIVERLGVTREHERLLEAEIDLLVDASFLEREVEDLVLVSGAPTPDHDALDSEASRIEAEHGDVAAHVRFVRECSRRWLDVMRGEVPGTDVVFPGGSADLVAPIYRDNASVDYFNRQVAEVVRDFVGRRKGIVRAIEIGAGTGGTTAAILDRLDGDLERVQYVFTDKSNALVHQARQTFSTRGANVEFGLLDIEAEPAHQGYDSASFDLVIAANVLHATRDLRQTLRHARQLLRSHGWLVLSETTVSHAITTLTFGLLDGWWRFEDEERRLTGGPLLPSAMWEWLLEDEGFTTLASLGHETVDGYVSPQRVIVAEVGKVVTEVREPQRTVQAPKGAGTVASRAAQMVVRDVETAIVKSVAKVLEIAPDVLEPDVPYTEFGVDSVLAVEIVETINESLGITLRSTDLFNYPTIRKLAGHIDTQFPETRQGARPGDDSGDGDADRSVTRSGVGDEVSDSPRLSPRAGSGPPSGKENDDAILALLRKLASGEIDASEADEELSRL